MASEKKRFTIDEVNEMAQALFNRDPAWFRSQYMTLRFPVDHGIRFELIDAEIPLARGDDPKALGSGS